MSKYGFDEDAMLKEQDAVMASYAKRFALTQDDQNKLHQAHSPRRVPRGLSGLQVRRRINRFKKYGSKFKLEDFLGHRVELRWDDKLVMGISLKHKRPENRRQIRKLLRDILKYS